MAKIGVYIPDERMKDIERWRKAMNFSQLFMEAFDRAVAAQAQIGKIKGKEMKALVERLKRQESGEIERGWKQGATLGRQCALNFLNLSDLRKIGEGKLTFQSEGDNVLGYLDNYYSLPDEALLTREEIMDEKARELYTSDAATFRHGRNSGFVDAVKSVWDQIKHQF